MTYKPVITVERTRINHHFVPGSPDNSMKERVLKQQQQKQQQNPNKSWGVLA